MRDHTFLNEYYSSYDEEGRLSSSNHGKVEYLTTMKYIHKYLMNGMRILEVGAGTGRYSLTLAREGYKVNALELIEHNLDLLKNNVMPRDNICAEQGDALDLSRYEDETFDITLVLGPMYHLYTEADKIQALREASRVTKKDGLIYVAYCMNEGTVLQFCFGSNKIHECIKKNMITDDFHCISKPEDLFELVRIEDINRLNKIVGLERLSLIASDGATNYMRPMIDSMDEETFQIYLEYHMTTCERQDLIGASHHTLDILKKS